MFKKTIFVALIIATMLLSGCAPQATPEPAKQPEAATAESQQPAAADATQPAAAEATQPAASSGGEVTITIESWRTDDTAVWEETILPAFNAKYAGKIKAVYAPTNPDDYNSVLNSKLQAGQAGDVLAVRPFDQGLALFNQKYLANLSDLKGLEHFSDVAKSAWITDDKSAIYAVPMGSVIHGFIYNKDIFKELGLSEPKTEKEFFEVLEAIKKDGKYTPLAIGSKDLWEAESMGYTNFGPNYWHGEEGRQALIDGTKKFTDPEFVKAFETLAKWTPYLISSHSALTYSDAQNLFTMGKAAIYPAGSWEISVFEPMVDFEMGAFKPPLPEGETKCYICDHVDIAMGMNATTKHPEEAKTFLEWMTTEEFADLYSNSVSGFFSLSDYNITLKDPLANTFASWRKECSTTIRLTYQIISRGEPNTSTVLEQLSSEVMGGRMSPQDAATKLQTGLEGWYKPQQAK
jgi:raffinose/stachyose/melibiose transport system substrate-binding protein